MLQTMHHIFLMEFQSVEGGFYRSGCCFQDNKAICQQIHQEIADVVRISEARDGPWKGKGAMWSWGCQNPFQVGKQPSPGF